MRIKDTDRIGFASEAKVEQALEHLRTSRIKLPFFIVGVVHAKRHSRLDHHHVDFLVYLEDGTEIPIQVKSSVCGARKFQRRYGSSAIVVVVVRAFETIEALALKLRATLIQAYNSLKRQVERIIYLERLRGLDRRPSRKSPCVRFHKFSMCH